MRPALRWGLILGGAVSVQLFVFALAGWHRSFRMAWVYLAVAIVLNVLAVVMCLRETATTDAWRGQLRNGVTLGLVAAVVIAAVSWFATAVVFPDYFEEMAEGYRQRLAAMDLSDEARRQSLAKIAGTSPLRSALEGFVGTVVVSTVAAAFVGIWLRRKEP